ncbi:MAG: hypothetical protein V1793_02465 [Pseudomonadota bacterium]
MANETQALKWEEYDEVEEITTEDQAESDDLTRKLLIGKFICTVGKPELREMPKAAGVQVDLKLQVDNVIEFLQVIKDENGKPIMAPGAEGEDKEVPMMKKIPVSPDAQEKMNAVLSGQHIYDTIKYPIEDEKGTHKKRRLFVAKKIGIIDRAATEMKRSDWLNAEGKQVVVETELNRYYSEQKKEWQENARVIFFGGYQTLDEAGVSSIAAPVDDDAYLDI